VTLPPAPPDEPHAPEAPPAAPPRRAVEGGDCPRCGTPYAPGQEYCLECGLRLPIAGGVVAVLRRVWRRRIPWYPGDWIWPVLLGLVIAALGAAAAIHFSPASKSSSSTVVATGPAGSTAPTTTAPEQPTTTAPTGTAPTAPTSPPPPTAPAPSKTLRPWPAGVSGYTVVLTSLPSSGGHGAAVAQARRALQAGLSDVGVLDSSKYSSLHPGYFVVFSGVYTSSGQAATGVSMAHSHGYGSAYPRRITP
jgi:hypothetical protein